MHFPKNDIWMSRQDMQRHSLPLAISERQMETPGEAHLLEW